jgi:hypothetical protein
MKIIKKHGYVPHASARILAGKSNKMIGVFITNIKHNSREFTIFGNTYISPLIAAIIDCASILKYNVLVLIIDKKNDIKINLSYQSQAHPHWIAQDVTNGWLPMGFGFYRYSFIPNNIITGTLEIKGKKYKIEGEFCGWLQDDY